MSLARTLGFVPPDGNLPDWPPGCALEARERDIAGEGPGMSSGAGVRGTGDGGGELGMGEGFRRSRKRFVYLATGEREEDFRYAKRDLYQT